MLTRNIFRTPIQQTNHLIHTSNGPLTINEATTIPPNNYFPIAQEFLIHKFSDHYDMLIGRKLVSKAKAVIDYQKGTATLFNKVYKIKDTKNPIEQNHAQTDPPFSQYPTFLETSTLQENLFRLDHLNREERHKLINLLTKFKDIQFHEGDKLSFTNQEKHTINTIHTIPVYSKLYSFQQTYEKEVEKQIQEMLEQGIIRESNSPYCSPIWVVPKKLDASGQQKLRIVID